MLNKKILAVAIAAAMSHSALAAVNIDASYDGTTQSAVNFAQELAWGQDPVLVQNGSTPLNATAELRFTIAQGTSRYIRYDLSNGAVFNTDPTLDWTNEGLSDPRARIARGGEGESFVIFELTAEDEVVTEDIPEDIQIILEVDEVLLPVSGTTDIVFRLYEDVIDAISSVATNDLNSEDQVITYARSPFALLGSGVTGDFSDANDNTASVDTEFTRFLGDAAAVDAVATWDGASVSAETANVGTIDVDQLAATGFFNLDGNPLTGADIVGTDPVVTFRGDFSFGEWTVHEVTTTADAACTEAPTSRAYTMNAAKDSITMSFAGAQSVLETTDYVLCVDVAALDPTRDDVIVANPSLEDPYTANRIRKGQYYADLAWNPVTPVSVYDWVEADGAMGSTFTNMLGYIHYDTITVEIPYLTNLSTYNQRVVIVNDGPTDASYVVEFIAEEGYTATGGSQASGSVTAGTTSVLRGSNILDSVSNGTSTRTRSAAKLYIDGKDDDIQVMIQTVNMNTGATDTEVLNANSVVGKTTNYLNEKTPSSLD